MEQAVERQGLPADGPKLQQQRHAFEIVLNLLDLLDRQIEQSAVLQQAQIDLVKEAIEESRLVLNSLRQEVERLFHTFTVRALDNDDNVVIVAELGQVFTPALVVILVRTDEIAALRAVFKEAGECTKGCSSQHQGKR